MISFINQLRTLTAADPDFVAVTCQEESISRAELLRHARELRMFGGLDVDRPSKHSGEEDGKEDGQQANATVGSLLPHDQCARLM